MTDHIAGRDRIIAALREELVGPNPVGTPLDTSQPVVFPSAVDADGPFYEAGTGQEILQRDTPAKRYGIAVLYPRETPVDEAEDDDVDIVDDRFTSTTGEADEATTSEATSKFGDDESDDDDLDLSRANDYRPSCIALSFLIAPSATRQIIVTAAGGRYRPLRVIVKDPSRFTQESEEEGVEGRNEAPRETTWTWWVRSDVLTTAEFNSVDFGPESPALISPTIGQEVNVDALNLQLRAFVRPRPDGKALVTVALINGSDGTSANVNPQSLFQVSLEIGATGHDGEGAILPYPPADATSAIPEDEQASFDLLYRNCRTFAVGHGCAADWGDAGQQETVRKVSAAPLPTYEAPSITPEIRTEDGSFIGASMARLAGLDTGGEWLAEARSIVEHYQEWIQGIRDAASVLDEEHRPAAARHIAKCEEAANRMNEGIALLERGGDEAEAFKLANHAILLQQLRARSTHRTVTVNKKARFSIAESYVAPSWDQEPARGQWRPFQIAFLLSALPSAAEPNHEDRALVELIWFPTGGGKTEAYLGLAAFSMFLRRLRDPDDVGTQVVMRYTLRLLTTQQFLRAGALICAMEHLRNTRQHSLGESPFTIGAWLGSGATPNSRSEARSNLRLLNRRERYAENAFLLLRCPWCSAQMGPVERESGAPRNAPSVAGYTERDGTVVLHCPDRDCEFHGRLPILVIDEDIYEEPPSMIVGTVDKFALLAWQPQARAIFGIDGRGERIVSPPDLIIQDELHLISGPLGSVVGLYEPVVERLCTDADAEVPVVPKIVSSTATIRRYENQIKALYGRERVALFPPPGLDADESFFSRRATDGNGDLLHGRIYLGVHGNGLGSILTAQVRTFSALFQAANQLPSAERDPWWTLLVFFNSLRELGTTVSLTQSDIPNYLQALRRRYGLTSTDLRSVRIVKELTGRRRRDEIPKALEELSRPAGRANAVDICLASNIIEVGIDIERLSLMCVVGQPKSTSQYIQVTGRVGRNWRERPGLVVTILNPSKPRDRSHYERFRTYHERLYAQVEPTSVTPFAPPVLERALHAVICALIRQTGQSELRPWPMPEELFARAAELLADRVARVDPTEAMTLQRLLERRHREWSWGERTDWQGNSWTNDGRAPLLRRAGDWVPPPLEHVTWSTPTSMRNVDAECRIEVTTFYASERGQSE